uniref:Uncharacterized protein n=1 Tax=Arundo donax TaxID=35708 RepID=A0A0A9H0W6_ARUDO
MYVIPKKIKSYKSLMVHCFENNIKIFTLQYMNNRQLADLRLRIW